MELLTGFLVGLLGSFHCIGMCGPIAIALPKTNNPVTSRLIYNFGRIITYSMLGLLFGLLGSRLEMFGLQRIISISLGILIILTVITPVSYRIRVSNSLGLYKPIGILKMYFGRMLKTHTISSMLVIGLLNGLLPCGFVYIGITGAIAVGSTFDGMLFMAMFGLGTLPVMLGTSLIGSAININLRQKLTRLLPALSIVLAIIFILRGLNLGIPYLSPKLEHKPDTEVICH
ncbi:MAG TPA: sulfite exporter TauE/SafE family protein [Ignavibacteria bacterium]|nr:sulfite exporter TauE/SafE family protein [Ignavibacteria bacterium]HRF67366.1 sulfite exporter TauE/SafE family protein [Ignavibacteria bacterium]HRJ03064.1 sulfite exporter TauE/SafE family protein [Ignavibacteria bacterium]